MDGRRGAPDTATGLFQRLTDVPVVGGRGTLTLHCASVMIDSFVTIAHRTRKSNDISTYTIRAFARSQSRQLSVCGVTKRLDTAPLPTASQTTANLSITVLRRIAAAAVTASHCSLFRFQSQPATRKNRRTSTTTKWKTATPLLRE